MKQTAAGFSSLHYSYFIPFLSACALLISFYVSYRDREACRPFANQIFEETDVSPFLAAVKISEEEPGHIMHWSDGGGYWTGDLPAASKLVLAPALEALRQSMLAAKTSCSLKVLATELIELVGDKVCPKYVAEKAKPQTFPNYPMDEIYCSAFFKELISSSKRFYD